MKKFIRELHRLTTYVNTAMIHSKAQVSYLKPTETLPGGNAIIYLTNCMLRFDDNSKLKAEETFGIDGSLVDVTFVKSRTNKAGKGSTLVFDQDNGYDEELSLFIMLKNAGKINGAGAYLYLGDRSDMKFSQRGFKQKLAENEEFRQIFMDEVINTLKASLIADDDAFEYNTSNISNYIMNSINENIA